jgi:hypothetical protein
MKSAQSIYDGLSTERNQWLDRGRRSASLTIPYLIPRANTPIQENIDTFQLPWNGIGQRGVNNLSAKLLMQILPPTEAFFRFTLDPIEMEKQEAQMLESGASPEEIASVKSETELSLNKLELSILRSIETSNDRVMVHEALMHLLVAGNVLLHIAEDGLRLYPLNRYVLLRDPTGEPLLAVVCETMAIDQLPASIRNELKKDKEEYRGLVGGEANPLPDVGADAETVDIYTCIKWHDSGVEWFQEINNTEIEGTRGTSDRSTSPWLPLRMSSYQASSYGPGYVESACIADLQTAEALSQAVSECALVSAQTKHLVRPSGVTNAKQLADSPNGAYLPGNADDVFTIRTDKGSDINVAFTALQRIEQRLAAAFMLSEMRDAERVTAEEVRIQTNQIEMSLGSVYAILTSEFQAPYIRRRLALYMKQGGMQKLPEGLIQPMVSVGLAGVGRGNDLEKTARFMSILQQSIGPEGMAKYLNERELINRLSSAMGISPLGLVKSEQQIAAEMQQAQQQAMQQQLAANPQGLASAAQTVQEMNTPSEEPNG